MSASYKPTAATTLLATGTVATAGYPPLGSRNFSSELFGCCDRGALHCVCNSLYSAFCRPCYRGELHEKAGLPYWLGFCAVGNLVRRSSRQARPSLPGSWRERRRRARARALRELFCALAAFAI